MNHSDSLPIAQYALLSDCHSAALVSSGGSIDWLCFPRFDSPAFFARLLDSSAGHWSIRPVGEAQTMREYVGETMVLRTTFTTAAGTIVLRDALAVGPNERGHDLGRRRLTPSYARFHARGAPFRSSARTPRDPNMGSFFRFSL